MNSRISTNVPSFAYHPRLSRQNSFCEFDRKIYSKDQHLGQGAVGDTYLFRSDEKTQHSIVVKKILWNPYLDVGQLVKNNAVFSSRLLGKTAITQSSTNQTYYIAMPYIRGASLKSLAIQSRAEAVKVVIAVLEATKKLHDNNIVHGDLHSENILIYKNHYSKWIATLIDFDLSRVVGQRCAGIPGGPRAPECGNSLQPAEPAQDIYSLGYTFLQLPAIRIIGESIFSRMEAYFPHDRYSLSDVLGFFKLIDSILDYLELNRFNLAKPDFTFREDIFNQVKGQNVLFSHLNWILQDSAYHYPVAFLDICIQYWPSLLPDILYQSPRGQNAFFIMCSNETKLQRYCDAVVKSEGSLFVDSLIFISRLQKSSLYPAILSGLKKSIHNTNDLNKFIKVLTGSQQLVNSFGAEFVLPLLGSDKQSVLKMVMLDECFSKEMSAALLVKSNPDSSEIKIFINYFIKRFDNFETALNSVLLLVDKHCSSNKDLYKRALTSVNDIYREYLAGKLSTSCTAGFSLFGRSYSAKLNEASKLNLLINNPQEFKGQLDDSVVKKGKLGLIAQRVIKLG
jgi:serine/threonine protein kinase